MSLAFREKVSRAIEVSRQFVERYGKVYVMFSGGKDSVVSLDLVYRAVGEDGIRAIIFIEMVGNTDRRAVEYVHSIARMYGLEHKLLHLRTPFDCLEAVKRWGLPGFRNKWCYGEKWRLVRKSVEPPYLWVIGIKASDSSYRASPKWNRYIVELPELGEVALQPVIEFTHEDIWHYIRERNLPLNPCYELYGCGGVCMFCPFRDTKAIEKIMNDEYWCRKIVDTLRHIRSRSKFAVQVIKKWLRYAKCLSDEERQHILKEMGIEP